MTLGDFLAGAGLLGAVYCAGGLHGLHMAWTQDARIRKYAGHVVARIETAAATRHGVL
jgi:hypothetical protein